MVHRTNGNYIWTGEGTVIPNYPTKDVFADGGTDDSASLTQPVGTGSAALIYGSSSATGTGPNTEVVNGVQYKQVYRVHNLYHPTYPRLLNDCRACHVANGYNVPDQAKAVATTLDTGASFSDQKDDTLLGPGAAACMSCHQSDSETVQQTLRDHAARNGFYPQVFPNGRQDVMDAVKQH